VCAGTLLCNLLFLTKLLNPLLIYDGGRLHTTVDEEHLQNNCRSTILAAYPVHYYLLHYFQLTSYISYD